MLGVDVLVIQSTKCALCRCGKSSLHRKLVGQVNITLVHARLQSFRSQAKYILYRIATVFLPNTFAAEIQNWQLVEADFRLPSVRNDRPYNLHYFCVLR